MNSRLLSHIIIFLLLAICAPSAFAQRKVTPVNTQATATQPVNEFKNDTARINARMRESLAHYHDEKGNIIYIDTVTGKEWRDTTALNIKKPMLYPLLQSASVAVDLWNPLMRAFGQHYGLIDFSAQVNLHNRYLPTFETGLGLANNTPAANNFTYKSPLGVYFRIGADYNFLYNSTPDYMFTCGLRYGISPFAYSIDNITIESPYWDVTAHPTIPSQHAVVGWMEFTLGLRVNLWGPISAGWMVRYHSILHDANGKYGKPWYIPGYGARGGAITGSVSVFYTFDINKKPVPISQDADQTDPSIYIPTPEVDDPYTPGVTTNTSEEIQDTPIFASPESQTAPEPKVTEPQTAPKPQNTEPKATTPSKQKNPYIR